MTARCDKILTRGDLAVWNLEAVLFVSKRDREAFAADVLLVVDVPPDDCDQVSKHYKLLGADGSTRLTFREYIDPVDAIDISMISQRRGVS